MALLIGDVGGTHTRLVRLPDPVAGPEVRGHENEQREVRSTRPSKAIAEQGSDLGVEIARFLAPLGPVEAGCLAVAGPVFGGQVHLTNLGWTLDARILSESLGFPVTLINDFHAQALAMPALDERHLHRLAPTAAATRPPGDCLVVMGPGTGLGEAVLVPDGRGDWRVVAGEGGHARFAPRGERAIGLLGFLTERFGAHVSVERVLSGPGLASIAEFLGCPGTGDDPAADVTRRALAGEPGPVEALTLFVEALADEAANMALRCNAGRVFLTGGIPPKILPFLAPRFRAVFEDKGRYSEWLRTVPVDVVLHSDPGLIGAARAAL